MYEPFNPAEYIEKDLYNVLEAGKKAKIDQNLPLGFIIDGTQGMAKTTSASLLAKVFQPDFDVETQIGRGIDQFLKSYNHTIDNIKGKYKVCIYDEANDSDKGSARGRIQRILNQVLVATSRSEKVILIIIIHRFYKLGNSFFDNGLIDFLIHIDKKNDGKNSHFKVYDGNSMSYMMNLIKKNKVYAGHQVYSRSWPSFNGRIKCPPKDFLDEIELHSKAGKDLLRKKANREILADKYYSVSTIASLLQTTKSVVANRIKKYDLKKQYLKDKSGQILFYDKDLLGVLKKVIKTEE